MIPLFKNKTKFFLFNKSYKKGFLVLEILIAASIITVTILTATSITQKSISLSRQSIHIAQASILLEEGAEIARIYRDNSWNDIEVLTVDTWYETSFDGTEWVFTGSHVPIGIFTRAVKFSEVYRDAGTQDIVKSGGDLDPFTRKVDVEVSWYEGTQNVKKTLEFYIANIFE